MPDWENLRHLAMLAKGGSLSAAARMLGVEHATVARRIAALESELGLRVVDRRGRKLLLTPEGERLAAIASRMETEAMAAERFALAAQEGIRGSVTISAPPAWAAAKLVPPLVRLQAQHPELTIRILGEVKEVQLERREADIAIRLNRPRTGDLSIVRLGQVVFRFYASRAYLDATPPAEWAFIGFGDPFMADSPQSRRLDIFASGRPRRFLSNTIELQVAAARAGAGVAILPDFLAADEAELVSIDDGHPPLSRELWLAVHTDLRSACAVRAVVETLKSGFTPGR